MRRSLEIAAKDPAVDGMLVIMTPQGMTNPALIAEKLKPYAKRTGKPVLASWMGGAEVAAGEQILNRAGIPTFPFPDTAVRAFNYMWRYTYNLKGLYETPSLPQRCGCATLQRGNAEQHHADVRESQAARSSPSLSPSSCWRLRHSRPSRRASRPPKKKPSKAAAEIGYPVVVKLHSQTITHKTDVGGVQLNLPTQKRCGGRSSRFRQSVAEKAGAEHFHGVTVQPMVKLRRL